MSEEREIEAKVDGWQIDLGPGPQPNDRERQLALDLGKAFDESTGRAALLTTFAKAFAKYRVELVGE